VLIYTKASDMRQQLNTNTHGGILKTLEKHLMSNVILAHVYCT